MKHSAVSPILGSTETSLFCCSIKMLITSLTNFINSFLFFSFNCCKNDWCDLQDNADEVTNRERGNGSVRICVIPSFISVFPKRLETVNSKFHFKVTLIRLSTNSNKT